MTWIDEWAAEYERTTGRKAVLVPRGGGWYRLYGGGFEDRGLTYRRRKWEECTRNLKKRPSVEVSE